MSDSDAIAAAGELLTRQGFVAAGRQGFAVSNDALTTAEFVRNVKVRRFLQTNNDILRTPQRVRLDIDRGRVTAVASLENLNADFVSRGVVISRNKRAIALQGQWLLALEHSLEARLGRQESVEVAEQFVVDATKACKAHTRRQRRIALIVAGIIVLLIAFLIGVVVVSSKH